MVRLPQKSFLCVAPNHHGLAQQAAGEAGLTTVFGAQAAKRFRDFVESGGGDLDFSAIYREIEKSL